MSGREEVREYCRRRAVELIAEMEAARRLAVIAQDAELLADIDASLASARRLVEHLAPAHG
jgi:hypothetical protein